MRYITEENLYDFNFWSGGLRTAKCLEPYEMAMIENWFENNFRDGDLTASEINNFFWFKTDEIAQILGFENWEDYLIKTNKQDLYLY